VRQMVLLLRFFILARVLMLRMSPVASRPMISDLENIGLVASFWCTTCLPFVMHLRFNDLFPYLSC